MSAPPLFYNKSAHRVRHFLRHLAAQTNIIFMSLLLQSVNKSAAPKVGHIPAEIDPKPAPHTHTLGIAGVKGGN